MALDPNATWRGPTVNKSVDGMSEWRGLVVHIAEGNYEGTISWCKNPDSSVSTHFVTDYDGKLAQMVDTKDAAWTQRAGNGHWVSVENAGFTPNALTPQQIETLAGLLAWCHQAHGVPLQLAFSPDERGLGHHSMGTNGGSVPTDDWTGPTWGHEDCPGPAIIGQKQQILDRAIQMVGGGGGGGAPPTTGGQDSMIIFCKDAAGNFYRCDGILCTPIPADQIENQTYVYAGLNEWAPVGQKANAVGPSYYPAQPVPGVPGHSSYLKIYDMGAFGAVPAPPSGGGGGGPVGPVDVTDAAALKIAVAVAEEDHRRSAS